jgi:Ser/Thr protein kinase RdoA (MazF antagonist)
VRPYFVDHADDYGYLVEIAPTLKAAAGRLSRTTPHYGLCHGDVNSGNIHFAGKDIWALLDFDYVGYGWRVMDIATFVNNSVYEMDRTARTRRVRDAFLVGYQSVRALSEGELSALPQFVVMRQMWLFGVVAIRNLRNFSREVYDHWVFDVCMPFIRAWMQNPW